MALLSKKKQTYLGIDLGTTSIKVVELEKKEGKPFLVTYGYAERAMGDIVRGSAEEIKEKTVSLLKRLCQKARVTSYQVVTALPNFSVFSSVITLPSMPHKDLTQAVQWEAKKIIPIPIEEVILDWKMVGETAVKEEATEEVPTPAEEEAGKKELTPDISSQPPLSAMSSLSSGQEESLKGPAESSTPSDQSIGAQKIENNLKKLIKESSPKEVETEGLSLSPPFSQKSDAPTKDVQTKEKSKFKPEEKPSKKKNLRILLTAASKVLINRYIEIFKAADLQLLSLETEAFALVRSLIGKDPASIMLLDSSAVTTDVIIVERGVPVLNRSVDIGGVTITRAIANSLNIDFKRAEQFKRDMGIGDSSGKVAGIIANTMKPVFDEISYSLNLYQTQTNKKVEKIILSGGSASLPNLDRYLQDLTKLKVFIGDPWNRITYPEELRPALEEIASRFAVVIGLALREIEK